MKYSIENEEHKLTPKKKEVDKNIKKRKPIKVVDEQELDEIEEPKESKDTQGKSTLWKLSVALLLVFIIGCWSLVALAHIFQPKINTIDIGDTKADLGIIQKKNEDDSKKGPSFFDNDDTLNVLLLGLDGEGFDDTRSDVIIIASISKNSDKIKLLSVQRDTLVYIPITETYEKINHSYAYGGAREVVKVLNTNYDLNIKDVIVFDYNALRYMVDAVGGVEVDVPQDILSEVNRHVYNHDVIPSAGKQIINGNQALGYVRARMGMAGGVLGRDERQREVIYKIFNYAKTQSIKNLIRLANDILPHVQTSYDIAELSELIEYFDLIRNVSLEGKEFPFTFEGATVNELYHSVPTTPESNGIRLHKYLFGDNNYKMSSRAMEINNYIVDLTGVVEEIPEDERPKEPINNNNNSIDNNLENNQETPETDDVDDTDYTDYQEYDEEVEQEE